MYHVITHILQALMQAAEPDDPQDAVVAQQVTVSLWKLSFCVPGCQNVKCKLKY